MPNLNKSLFIFADLLTMMLERSQFKNSLQIPC